VKVDNHNGLIEATIVNTRRVKSFPMKIQYFDRDTIRVWVDEESDLHSRYELESSIVGERKTKSLLSHGFSNSDETGDYLKAKMNGDITLILQFNPIKISLLEKDVEYFSLNGKKLFNVEHFRAKPASQRSDNKAANSDFDDDDDDDFDDDEDEDQEDLTDEERTEREIAREHAAEDKRRADEEKKIAEAAQDQENETTEIAEDADEPGMWDESFKTHKDSKPRGPESIGMDMNFIGYKYIYGIPEHADRFWLKDTKNTDPYRLYNLDVFEYELDETMALYGSIPWVLAHNTHRTMGVLWLNPSETWVDVDYEAGSQGGLFSSEKKDKANVHFMSESGIVDIWIMQGPTPQKALDQLTYWTGRPIMPALWSLGYHQCRWNYRDEDDVEKVDAGFEEHDLPFDVIWLDIEHTDGKRYFTWDKVKFPTPQRMIEQVASKGRKMVTIVDPHVKVDNNYHLYQSITKKDLWTKREGKNFEGWCWPGNSGYPDFDNPEMQKLWAEHFSYTKYVGSTPALFTWNDMNEPSVFNGPEITMHKDVTIGSGWEHRHVHNLYGFYVHLATMEGHLHRNREVQGNVIDRPFVLSRAMFVGTQRAGAIWTGDNKAEWKHMEFSVPMCLSIGISGVPFIGADVGGFFGNPDTDLLVRWYQHGALQPFFRAHAHIDAKRREPWLFGDTPLNQIRTALRLRYRILSYIYTTFREAHETGNPVMRPIFWEFPKEEAHFAEQNQWMLGANFLACSMPNQGQMSVEVSLPTGNWYRFPFEVQNFNELDAFTPFQAGKHNIHSDMNTGIPVFLRGGTITLTKERARRNSVLQIHDPYTMYIAVDANGKAKGHAYDDDGRTFEGEWVKTAFVYDNGVLGSEIVSSGVDAGFRLIIERIILLKPNGKHVLVKKPDNLMLVLG
jgi:alpha 1,3-glucosidase